MAARKQATQQQEYLTVEAIAETTSALRVPTFWMHQLREESGADQTRSIRQMIVDHRCADENPDSDRGRESRAPSNRRVADRQRDAVVREHVHGAAPRTTVSIA